MSSFSDFQTAIYTALIGDPAITALVSSRIFDDVPHESESTSTVFPRITIGDQSADAITTAESDLAEFEVTLHVWSRAAGRKECLNILNAIMTSLHRKEHLVSVGKLVTLNYTAHETGKEVDGETYHGQIRFTGLYQFT